MKGPSTDWERTISAAVQPDSQAPRYQAGRPLKILMTEGTSLSARQSLYAIGGKHTIDVIDPNPLCQCRFSGYVRRWFRSPHFAKDPEGFLRFLSGKLAEGEYDVLLPTHEQVYLLSRFRDSFTSRVGLALPSFDAMERMQNKAHFSRCLTELGLPSPESQIVSSENELLDETWRFPLYLKLAHSTAGAGVFLIRSAAELRERVRGLERQGLLLQGQEAVMQQPAKGVQATVQAVFRQGELLGIHSFEARRLGVGGMSSARISADHPLVREQVARLGEHLAWHGAMFIDYFYDRDTARPEYIECNPRIGETVNAKLCGVNLCELLVRLSAGEPVERLPLGRFGVKTQSFYMILLASALEGATRRELWREIQDYRQGRGLYQDSEDELTRVAEDGWSRLPLFWIAAQLLAWPGQSKNIVRQTVENYSLPESATERIKSLPLDLLRS